MSLFDGHLEGEDVMVAPYSISEDGNRKCGDALIWCPIQAKNLVESSLQALVKESNGYSWCLQEANWRRKSDHLLKSLLLY